TLSLHDALPISGILRSRAMSNSRASFSPTTTPMLPPMNSKSITPIATGRFSILPIPTTTASLRPLLARACSIRAGYGLESTKPSGSPIAISAISSRHVPRSTPIESRCATVTRKWYPHLGHTFRLRSTSLRNAISLHAGHFDQMSSDGAGAATVVGSRSAISVPHPGRPLTSARRLHRIFHCADQSAHRRRHVAGLDVRLDQDGNRTAYHHRIRHRSDLGGVRGRAAAEAA